MDDNNPKSLKDWQDSLKDENLDELDAKIKAKSEELEAKRILKLAELELKTPQILKLAEQKLQNERLDQQLKEVEEFEAKQLKTISLTKLLETEFPAQQWIIDHFLPEGGITMLVGEAGTLKSYISLYIAKVLLTQEKLFGEFETNRKCKILLIDKENKLPRIQRRMKGLGMPKEENLWVIQYPETFILENKEWVSSTKDFITENKIDVVIFDSFIDFFTGNENSSTDTSMAINAIRSLSQTSQYILIHHDSKPLPKFTRTAAQKTRGSSNIIAQVDTQFYFEKGKDNKSLIIEQGKSRDEEPLKKFSIEIVSTEEGIQDFLYKGELKSELTMAEETADLFYSQIISTPMISRDELFAIANTQNYTERTCRDGLNIILKKGLIDFTKKPGEGNKRYYFQIEDSESSDVE